MSYLSKENFMKKKLGSHWKFKNFREHFWKLNSEWYSKKITIKQCTNKDIRKSLCWMCRICPVTFQDKVLISLCHRSNRQPQTSVAQSVDISHTRFFPNQYFHPWHQNHLSNCYWTYTTHSTKGLSYILICTLLYRYFFFAVLSIFSLVWLK